MNIEEILALNDKSGKIFKENYLKKYYNVIYKEIIEYSTSNNLYDLSFKQKFYHYYKNIPSHIICECGKLINFLNFTKGYNKHCSIKCAHNDKNVMNKTRLTMIDKHGVDNPQKSEVIRERTHNTNLLKFGYKHAAQSEDVQKKMRTTNLSILGVEFPAQNKSVRDKFYKSIIDKNLLKYKDLNLIQLDYDKKILTFKCDFGEDHIFNISTDLFQNRKKTNIKLCTVCNTKFTSMSEKDFFDFFQNIEIKKNTRTIIPPLELDIYIPELKLAFEFNGLYWHSEVNKEKNYHLNKTQLCEEQGIQLIHIWEDDWLYKKEIIKSMILNKLNQTPNKIFARKTEIKEIFDNKLVREFLDFNHIQGFVGSKVKLGLFYEDELVSLMTFGNRRVAMGKKTTNQDEYELLRFCNKLNTNVVGGASRLFKYFIKEYQPKEITTYADRSISQGKLYETLGFISQGKTEPNYYYIISGIRHHRFNFRKDILVKKGFNPNKTEHEIMIERKIYRIYDSGNLKFILSL